MFKAVLFDLDDTLTKSSKIYNKSLRFAADFVADKYNLDREEFFKTVLEKHFVVAKNFPSVHTRHSRILVFRMALDSINKPYDLALLPDIEDLYWDYFIKHLELYDGVLETLEELKKRKIKTAIVSDGDLSLRIKKAKASGVLPYMDELVASEEVIFEKPFSAIFTLALTRLKVKPQESLMVGNNYKNDIRGAQLVGIKTCIFAPKEDANVEGQDGTIKEDFRIEKFGDLLKLI